MSSTGSDVVADLETADHNCCEETDTVTVAEEVQETGPEEGIKSDCTLSLHIDLHA